MGILQLRLGLAGSESKITSLHILKIMLKKKKLQSFCQTEIKLEVGKMKSKELAFESANYHSLFVSPLVTLGDTR